MRGPVDGLRVNESASIDLFHDHGHNTGHMETIQASKFKAQCLALMDEVASTGKTIVVTKNGRPVAELRPVRQPRAKTLLGLHKGKIRITGDIVGPVMRADNWNALK